MKSNPHFKKLKNTPLYQTLQILILKKEIRQKWFGKITVEQILAKIQKFLNK